MQGATGFETKLRRRSDLVVEGEYEKHVMLELRGAQEVADFAIDQGSTYQKDLEFVFENDKRDVVGIRTAQGDLSRVDSLASARSTAGTFYYQLFEGPTGASWDDGVTQWDDGTLYDQLSFLYIHLPDGGNPNNERIAAQFGFFFSNASVVHPTLGGEKISNGDFEDDLTGWTTGSGSAAVAADGGNPIDATKSLLFTMNAASSNFRELTQDVTLESGTLYRMTLLYSVGEGVSTKLIWKFSNPSADLLRADHRHWGASADASVFADDTQGEVRVLVVDFLAVETGTHTLTLRGEAADFGGTSPRWDDGSTEWDNGTTWDDTGAGAGKVRVDLVSIKPAFRFEAHEPRISARALPVAQSGSRDIFFEALQIGSGSVSLVNADAYFDRLSQQLNFEGQDAVILMGGRHGDGGEVPSAFMDGGFSGRSRRMTVDDRMAQFPLEDARTLILRKFPENRYGPAGFANLDPAAENNFRPVWFGPATNVSPTRINLTANNYGIYELADISDIPNGIEAIDFVYAYVTKADADAKDLTKRISLTVTTHFTKDIANAQLTIVSDVAPRVVDETKNAIDFNDGSPEVVFLAAGLYTAVELAAEAQAKMDAESGDTITVSYSESTHKFTFASDGGTFQLNANGGPNTAIAAWQLLGVDPSTDKVGATSYVGENPVFTLPEDNHVIRVDGTGARDTVPGGDFTGTSGDPIEKGADILRTFWVRFLNQSESLIDETSLIAARVDAPERLCVYLDTPTEMRKVFEKLQNSNFANVVIDNKGKLRYIVTNEGEVPADVIRLSTPDFLSFSITTELDDVYQRITIRYGRDPSTGDFQEVASIDDLVPVMFERSNEKVLDTYLVANADAKAIATTFLALSSKAPRKAKLELRAVADVVEGMKFLINRRRGASSTQGLQNELFRVLLVRRSPDTGVMEALTVEE